jgi:hypothetical protein
VEQKKGADGGLDGKVLFRDHPDAKAKPNPLKIARRFSAGSHR